MKRFLTGIFAALLSVAAFGTTLNPVQLLNPVGSTSGQAIVSTGASTAPAWGSVTATALAAQAANTVVANITASSASPTAVAIPTCNTSVSALNYTPVTGWTCNAALITAATAASTYAPLASPTFTGTPAAPTATAGTSTTQLATTAFVTAQPTINQPNIVGVTAATSASAGSIGQTVCSAIPATPAAISNATPTNLASVSLSAGLWSINGSGVFVPATGTSPTQFVVSVNTVSATILSTLNGQTAEITNTFPVSPGTMAFPVTAPPLLLGTTTTVFLVGQAAFSGSTMQATGVICALRVH